MRNAFVYFVSFFSKHAQFTIVSYNTIPKAELVRPLYPWDRVPLMHWQAD